MVHVGVGGAEPPRAWTERSSRSAPPTPGISIDPRDWPTRSFLGFAQLLSGYHRHQVFHLDRLEQLFHERRRVIVVGNRALDIVDPLLFLAQVYRRLGRVPYFVGHEEGMVRSARSAPRARRDPEAFARLHRRTWVRCQTFLDAVVSRREAWSDGLDRSVRSFEGMLQELGL